jgi:hypothetical protein
MGKILYDLGNIYQKPGLIPHNGSVLFWAYSVPLDPSDQPVVGAAIETLLKGKTHPERSRRMADLPQNLREAVEEIDAITTPLSQAQMARGDAGVIKQEVALTAAMLKHGARRLLAVIGDDSVTREEAAAELNQIVQRYQQVWLLRNRPGGLSDSVARLTRKRSPYPGLDIGDVLPSLFA